MADDTSASASAEETQLTFNVKAANDAKYVITVPASTTVGDLKAKLSTSDYADIPAERQRLIYSGRVLKDPDTLATVKIKDGHTVHLVKGAASNARQNPANQGTSTSSGGSTPVPQVPTNLAAGTGNNPLAGLTGARYAGFHGLPGMDTFGPDGGMGPPPDPEQLLQMMDNPMFLSQMNEAMNNPAVIEMLTQNPMFRSNPMLADMIRNPEMRRMLLNPEMIRMQMQMQRAMGGSGARSSFPAPGVTNTTPQSGDGAPAANSGTPNPQNPSGTAQVPQDPFASLLSGAGAGAPGANPFANLFGSGPNPFLPPQPQNTNATSTGSDTNTTSASNTTNPASSPPPNPFGSLFGSPAGGDQNNPLAEMTRRMMQNPEAMRAALQMMGMEPPAGSPMGGTTTSPPGSGTATGGPAANPFAALFGPGLGGPPAPADTRPPEEVYEVQLRQLNEMGFYEFERNVQALRRSGGNVQVAIEYLLGGGGT